MAKGYRGESCAEAVRDSIRPGETATFSELYARTKTLGAWRDETIWQHLMGLVVNLPPARQHWPNKKPFLFLRPDGRYEVYNSSIHPQVIE